MESTQAFLVLQARIRAAKSTLSALRGAAAFMEASAGQSDALIAALADVAAASSFSMKHKIELSQLVADIPFHDGHADAVVLAIYAAAPTANGVDPCRRTTQDFTTIVDFFTKDEWGVLLSNAGAALKQELLRGKIIQCTGRNLNEVSCQLVTAVELIVTQGFEQAAAMSERDKNEALKAFKRVFKRDCRAAGNPISYIVKLPVMPSELFEKYPSVFRLAFPDEHPIKSQLDSTKVATISGQIRMRLHRASDHPGIVQACDRQEQGLGAVMQQMQQMQQFQMMAFQAMLGGGDGPRVLQRGLGGVAGFANGLPSFGNAITTGVGAAASSQALAGRTNVPGNMDFGSSRLDFGGRMTPLEDGDPLTPPSTKRRNSELHGDCGGVEQHVAPDSGAKAKAASDDNVDNAASDDNVGGQPALKKIKNEAVTDAASSILMAMQERDAKKKEADRVKAQERRTAEAAAKSDATTARVRVNGKTANVPVPVVVPPPRAAAASKAATAPKAAAAPKAAIAPKAAAARNKGRGPSFSVERSRSQVLCRSGIDGKGGSIRIPYGMGKECVNEHRALIKAREWLAEERSKFGLIG